MYCVKRRMLTELIVSHLQRLQLFPEPAEHTRLFTPFIRQETVCQERWGSDLSELVNVEMHSS